MQIKRLNNKRKAPAERKNIRPKISKRDTNSAAETLVTLSSSDLFHGKNVAELEAAEAMTSFAEILAVVGSKSAEVPVLENYDMPMDFVNQNTTTETSSQV